MNQATKITLVYDGYCRLCSWGVAWLLRHVSDNINFLPSQSAAGTQLMTQAGINALDPQTVLVVAGNNFFMKSDALLFLMKMQGRGWSILAAMLSILPPSFLDWLYLFIAKRRYRWFGKLPSCLVVPAPKDH